MLRASLNRKLTFITWTVLMAGLMHLSTTAETGDFSLDSAGGRYGFGADHKSRGFHSAEALLNCTLPISWELRNDFSIKTRMDFTAGWLGRSSDSAATASVGPVLVLNYKTLPVSLEAGSSSTLISQYRFDGAD